MNVLNFRSTTWCSEEILCLSDFFFVFLFSFGVAFFFSLGGLPCFGPFEKCFIDAQVLFVHCCQA